MALGAIAALLIVAGVISGMELRRMSSTVSDSIDEDITNISISQKIAATTERFNLQILETIGEADSLAAVTNFNLPVAISELEDVFLELSVVPEMELTDSLLDVFINYIEEARNLEAVVCSDYLSSKKWYFSVLQPYYNTLNITLDSYNEDVHLDLMEKADDFDMAFYRSMLPTMVTMVAGLLLLFLLLFFILTYYIAPIRRMLGGLDDYTQRGRRYSYDFEGDDELKKLNDGISALVEENVVLRKRIKALKEKEE